MMEEVNIMASSQNQPSVGSPVKPMHGGIYRTAGNESIVVLKVHKERIFVEYADGRHGHLSWRDWSAMSPVPAVC